MYGKGKVLFLFIVLFSKKTESIQQLHFNSSISADANKDEEGIKFFDKYLHFRFKEHKNDSRHLTYPILNRIPEIFNRFDWVFHGRNYGWKMQLKIDNPKIVFINQDLLSNFHVQKELLMFKLRQLRPVKGDDHRALVIGSGDLLASNAREALEMLVKLKRFSAIWYEGVDVRIPGIKTIPSGYNAFYLVRCGLRNIVRAVQRSDSFPEQEKSLVCVSFGDVCWFFDEQPNRRALVQFVNASSWVQRSLWPAHQYWDELLKHKFMLAPHGNGLQSAKFWECMMVRVVPVTVTAPAFEDLQGMGFPLLLVRQWSDVTPELLENYYEREGRAVNWTWVRGMLEVDRIIDILLQG